ncbi:MAG: hypothetical protein H6613_06800 [Ignavibacteriales bacterium]|nr:hypothetical protein [Ignavibacteriales bacterium]
MRELYYSENVIGDIEFYGNVFNGYQIISGTGTEEQNIVTCFGDINWITQFLRTMI